MARWKRKDVLLLIEMFKQNAFLYDINHRDFYDPFKRELLFGRMRDLFKRGGHIVSVDEIERKIKSLRCQYANEKSLMDKYGSCWNCEPKLWCYERLQFLDPHLRNWEGHPNIPKSPRRVPPSKERQGGRSSVETRMATWGGGSLPSHAENSKGATDPTWRCGETRAKASCSSSVPWLSADAAPSKGGAEQSRGVEGREEAFARFVTEELRQIRDIRVYNETKWQIQLALREGIRRQAESETGVGEIPADRRQEAVALTSCNPSSNRGSVASSSRSAQSSFSYDAINFSPALHDHGPAPYKNESVASTSSSSGRNLSSSPRRSPSETREILLSVKREIDCIDIV